jgi:hypothetical protein
MCIGILLMRSGTALNFFLKINKNLFDFLRGLGITLVLAGFFFLSQK